MDERTIRKIQDEQYRAKRNNLTRSIGLVSDTSPFTVTIEGVEMSGLSRLSGWTPEVGDRVLVTRSGASWLVHGPIGVEGAPPILGTYTATVGNGSSTDITVAHNLGTREVIVRLRTSASPYDEVVPSVTFDTVDEITLSFLSAPASAEFTVTIVSSANWPGAPKVAPSALVERSSDQSIADQTWSAISFDDEVLDTDDMWDSGDPTKVTVQTPGVYIITASCQFDGDTDGLRVVGVERNGTATDFLTEMTDTGRATVGGGSAGTAINAVTTAYLEVGDYVRMMVWHNALNSLDVMVDFVHHTRFGVTLVSRAA